MAPNKLNIYYQNCRGLRSKTMQFKQNLLSNDFDIIIITETWLHDGILDGELCDTRYDVFRNDRDLAATGKATGGGVMILSRHSLGAWSVPRDLSSTTEILTIIIPGKAVSAGSDLYVSAVYIPPNAHTIPLDIDFVLKVITATITQNARCRYLLLGDFNLPCINWHSSMPTFLKQGSLEVQNASMRLVNELGFLGLVQYNALMNHKGNTLDLAFSSLPLEINECSFPLTKIDLAHPVFTLEVLDLTVSPFTELCKPKHNYRKADYNLLNEYYDNIDWPSALGTGSTEETVKIFYNIVQRGINKLVPLTRRSGNRKYPVWYTKGLINIIKEKFKAHSRWKKYGNLRDYDEFSLLRARQCLEQKKCFNNYVQAAEFNVKTNPKYFWTYIKALRGSSSYPKRLTYKNVCYSDGKEICDAFNDFFHSVFSAQHSSYSDSSENCNDTNCNTIISLQVSLQTVEGSLKSLNVDKGAGCDGIPAAFWKGCTNSLAEPIHIIFNRSLKEGIFPEAWKRAHIVPIHKKGTRANVENYRGISILNILGKLFEKIVYDCIYPYIATGVPNTQHGFMRRRSTTSNLACFTSYLLKNTDRGGQVDVIYTDFEKAFDRVDHVILLNKLFRLGIRGDLLRWIKSYLSNRSQAVVVGGYRSDFIEIPSGVPQGSHLGPLFYNAYLFDIHESFINSEHLMYADDKKIFLKIKSISDCELLQADLDNLTKYYNTNKITVNVNKCQCISYSRKIHPVNFQYNFNGIIINRVKIVRDLGVIFDNKLSFSEHIDFVTTKAFKNLGFVIRSCKIFKDVGSIKSVYFAYVRSILEYACPIWSPFYIIYVSQLERLQQKFVNHLNYRLRKPPMSYQQSCNTHGMLTLEQRRKILEMCLLYDILNGNLDCADLLSQVKFNTPQRRTRHTPMLYVPIHATNYAQNNVVTRIVRTHNTTFKDIDIFTYSKKTFKTRLVKALIDKQPDARNYKI